MSSNVLCEEEQQLARICALLCSLGVTANYAGFFHASYAVYLASQRPERLLLVTKRLYPEVARHYGTTWRSVELNIRTVAQIAWNSGREQLEQMAHCPLAERPNASRFLAILTGAVFSGRAV